MNGAHRINALSIIHHPHFGGPHNRMSIVARLLEPEGVHVTVVIPEDAPETARRLRNLGVDVVAMPLHRVRATRDWRVHLEWARRLRWEVAQLTDLIRARHIDVVATNTLPNLHGALAARRANVACVWQIIDTFPPPAARWLLMPFVLSMSDVVMTTGIGVARQHPGTRRLGDRWMSFYPCVDMDRFQGGSEARQRAREELGLDDSAVVVGNVATINPMKGHRYFIEAAARLRKQENRVRFVILGSVQDHYGPYLSELEALAAEHGLRVGEDLIIRDPGAQVPILAPAFDIFWMTSEPNSEGIPTAVGEAKALGLPVVAVDVGSMRECVTDGVSGFVVPPRDTKAIAEATLRLTSDPRLRREMSVAAQEEAVRDFSSEKGATMHKLAFQRAIEHHGRRRWPLPRTHVLPGLVRRQLRSSVRQ